MPSNGWKNKVDASLSPNPQSPFWQFSLSFYALPAVSAACIALQDTCGADANVLLFLLWLARSRRRVETADLDRILQATRNWQAEIVAPLRRLRRTMKTMTYGMPGEDAVRMEIKRVELDAERLEQERLCALVADPTFGRACDTADDAAAANLALYEATLDRAFMPDATNTLRHALNELREQ